MPKPSDAQCWTYSICSTCSTFCKVSIVYAVYCRLEHDVFSFHMSWTKNVPDVASLKIDMDMA